MGLEIVFAIVFGLGFYAGKKADAPDTIPYESVEDYQWLEDIGKN